MAVDQSMVALQNILSSGGKNIDVVCADMSRLNFNGIDVVYSRFSLHSITEQEQTRVLDWAKKSLNPGGLLCIEVRSDKDSFEGDHYRRFINFDKIKREVLSRGFQIEFSNEGTGFAVFKDEDPMIIRLIATKK